MYAFVKAGVALYVGVATVGLAKRLYFYGRPGITQRTSQRLNAAIKTKIAGVDPIEIYVALPSDLEWNGAPCSWERGSRTWVNQEVRASMEHAQRQRIGLRDEATRLIREHFSTPQASELKYRALSRTLANQPRLLGLLRDIHAHLACTTSKLTP